MIKSWIVLSEVASVISEGREPVNLLKEIFKISNDFNAPIEFGIVPEILFLKRFIEVRNFKSEIELGKFPVRLLSDKSIETTLSFTILTPYQVVTEEFKFHLFDQFSPWVDLFKSIRAFFSETEISANDAKENNSINRVNFALMF